MLLMQPEAAWKTEDVLRRSLPIAYAGSRSIHKRYAWRINGQNGFAASIFGTLRDAF